MLKEVQPESTDKSEEAQRISKTRGDVESTFKGVPDLGLSQDDRELQAKIQEASSDIGRGEPRSITLGKGVTDAGLLGIVELSPISELILEGCVNITDQGLKEIGKVWRIDTLDLTGCTGITDEGLKSIAQKPSELILDDCPQITGWGLQYLGGNDSLTHLSLKGCTGLDRDIKALDTLHNASLHLRYLDLRGIDVDDFLVEQYFSHVDEVHIDEW